MLDMITDWASANWLLLALGGGLVVVLWLLSRVARNLRQATAGAGSDWVPWLIRFANAIGLGFNAEGMYFLLRDEVTSMPIILAAGGFFVFELFQVIYMIQAGRKYKVEHTPGKYAAMVWFIALSSVSVVCLHAATAAEVGIRVALAVVVVMGWQVTLTAAGVTKSRWVFAHWLESMLANAGLKIGADTNDGGIDYDKIRRDKNVKKMVTLRYYLDRGGLLSKLRQRKLDRLILGVNEEDRAAVGSRLRAVDETRRALGLKDKIGRSSDGSGTVELPDTSTVPGVVPGAVPGHETNGTGHGSHEHGSGTDRRTVLGHGNVPNPGTPVTELSATAGTGAEPDEVLIQSALLWISQHDKVPTVTECQTIFAAPGNSSFNRGQAGRILKLVKERLTTITEAQQELDAPEQQAQLALELDEMEKPE